MLDTCCLPFYCPLGPDFPTRRPVSTAESLLFGLRALQNNFIDRNGLVAAFDAWVTDKTKPLGQILLDRGARFIRGDNLEAAIERFHQDEQAGRDAGARTLALQELLLRLLAVRHLLPHLKA